MRVHTLPALDISKNEKNALKLRAWREALIRAGSYLGDPGTTKVVGWMKDGQTHWLVVHEEGEKRVIVPAKTRPADESIELSCVFQITEDDFWLMPDARWRGDGGGA